MSGFNESIKYRQSANDIGTCLTSELSRILRTITEVNSRLIVTQFVLTLYQCNLSTGSLAQTLNFIDSIPPDRLCEAW